MTTRANGKIGGASRPGAVDLCWRSWVPEAPRAVVAIVHGLGEHGGRYAHVGEDLAGRGLAVYAVDLRGHGKSDGRRVHIDRIEDYDQDISALLALVEERHEGLPRVLLGHSMGGMLAMRHVLDHPAAVHGAIISSPGLAAHPELEPSAVVRLAARILSKLAPRVLIDSGLKVESISRDPAVVEAYVADPLVSSKVSARWYTEILAAMADVRGRAGALRLPMLLMQSGEDRLVDPEATARWGASAPAEMVELVIWEGLYHEMLNEPENARVLDRVADWLERRLGF